MPASCANALAPTIALLGGTATPTIADSALLVGTSAWRVDAGAMRQRIGAHLQRHHDLFERRVAGALADAVDRALDLARAGLHRGQRIGDRQSEIVVAMRRQHRAVADAAGRRSVNIRSMSVGQRVADGVGQVDGRGAGVHRRFGDLAQELEVAARRVLRRELDVVAVGARVRDRRCDLLEALRAA